MERESPAQDRPQPPPRVPQWARRDEAPPPPRRTASTLLFASLEPVTPPGQLIPAEPPRSPPPAPPPPPRDLRGEAFRCMRDELAGVSSDLDDLAFRLAATPDAAARRRQAEAEAEAEARDRDLMELAVDVRGCLSEARDRCSRWTDQLERPPPPPPLPQPSPSLHVASSSTDPENPYPYRCPLPGVFFRFEPRNMVDSRPSPTPGPGGEAAAAAAAAAASRSAPVRSYFIPNAPPPPASRSAPVRSYFIPNTPPPPANRPLRPGAWPSLPAYSFDRRHPRPGDNDDDDDHYGNQRAAKRRYSRGGRVVGAEEGAAGAEEENQGSPDRDWASRGCARRRGDAARQVAHSRLCRWRLGAGQQQPPLHNISCCGFRCAECRERVRAMSWPTALPPGAQGPVPEPPPGGPSIPAIAALLPTWEGAGPSMLYPWRDLR